MLSPTGPYFAVGDANGDGRDDVFAGGGRGQGGQVLSGRSANGFTPMSQPALLADRACEDAGADWVDVDGDKDLDLVVSSAGYELPIDDPCLQVRLYLNDGKGHLTKATDFSRCTRECVLRSVGAMWMAMVTATCSLAHGWCRVLTPKYPLVTSC